MEDDDNTRFLELQQMLYSSWQYATVGVIYRHDHRGAWALRVGFSMRLLNAAASS